MLIYALIWNGCGLVTLAALLVSGRAELRRWGDLFTLLAIVTMGPVGLAALIMCALSPWLSRLGDRELPWIK